MSVKSTRGMSLVEILVAVGVFGIVSVVLSTSFVEMMKSQKNVENRDRANDFATSLGRMLYNDGSCSTMFCNPNAGGTCQKVFMVPTPGSTEDLELEVQFPGVSSDTLKKGVEVDRGVSIRELTVQDIGLPPQPVMVNGTTFQKITVRITLVLDLLGRATDPQAGSGQAVAHQTIATLAPRFYDIPLYIDPGTRQVLGCKIEMSTQDTCQLMGAELDSATGLCKPESQCMMFGHYITSVCSTPRTKSCPPNVPNSITRNTSCPAGSIASKTGHFVNSWTESCGKKCSFRVTNTQDYYICLRCTE